MAVRIKNRHRLKDREVKEFAATIHKKLHGDFLNEKDTVDTGTIEEFTVLLVNDSIDFLIQDSNILFTLQGLLKHRPSTHFVIVDMGAVGFIVKGADVMAPGITEADQLIQKDDFVWICDQKYRKPLATGTALMSGEEMKTKKPGKAVKTLQYVGDRFWMLTH
ncbi:MAG: RNA-binding protein [Candidatus Thermoplasmatota archaeon]|nr:RNA-binding protein [Candidatus Thermoplasmatota archaeon]